MVGQIGCPETSVSNNLTPPNSPEDGIIRFNRGENLRSCIKHETLNVLRGRGVKLLLILYLGVAKHECSISLRPHVLDSRYECCEMDNKLKGLCKKTVSIF